MAKSKGGRPKMKDYKKIRSVYLTDEQYRRCKEAAGDLTFSQWAARTLVAASGVR